MNFEQKVYKFIQKNGLLNPAEGVLIGLSGGADSVALLRVLCALRETYALRLFALHVHHGIRAEAQRDADFCEELCRKYSVEFACEYVDVPGLKNERGLSEEEAGRLARYRLFEAYRQKHGLDAVAVAHHQDDQAETILFQLFRGSGIRGLGGMPVKRDRIIRPLLGVSRKEIEQYLALLHQDYVTDATNLEDAYARNKIRHHIMPLAEQVHPKAAAHMCRCAGQLQEIEDYMQQQAEAFIQSYAEETKEGISVNADILKKSHIALQKEVLLKLTERSFLSRKDITERHILSVMELMEKEGQKEVHFPNGARVLSRYGQLIFQNMRKEEPENICVRIEPDQTYFLPDGSSITTKLLSVNKLENMIKNDCIKWFDYDRISSAILLRTRKTGDFLTVRDDGGKKSLQDYLVNEKVPREERDRCLLLADGQHIIWVIGKRISAYYKVTEHTGRILEVHFRRKEHG